MFISLYKYNAIVTAVYDGDSITVDINLGFGIWKKGEKIRLASINAPELRGEEREQGLISRDALREKILNKKIIVETQKDKKGKYGRYIGTIHLLNDNYLVESEQSEYVVVNDWLVENGFAKYVDY